MPSQRSHPHGPPSLRRVRLPAVPRLQRYSAALRLPHPHQPRLRSPLAFGLPRRRLFSSPPRTRSAYVRASESNHQPLRYAGLSPRKDEGLPGAWAILFLRAVLQDPAGCSALLAHGGGTCRGFQASQNPEHPGCNVSGADSHGSHARVPTHQRLRHRGRCKARYRPGRAHPWPDGLRTRWTTYEVSRRHRLLLSPPTSLAWSLLENVPSAFTR